jgi:hypothetical protein
MVLKEEGKKNPPQATQKFCRIEDDGFVALRLEFRQFCCRLLREEEANRQKEKRSVSELDCVPQESHSDLQSSTLRCN